MQTLLLSEMGGLFPGPSHRFWNLSDGGHFDHTGIYELLRRRVPVIIAVDAGEDPKLVFVDHSDLVRQARIDFGAKVEYLAAVTPPLPAVLQGWLDPLGLGSIANIGQTGGHHAALAKVTYDGAPGVETWIILLKASLTGDESLDIGAYKKGHDAFPSEPTTDQFFDEAQWESYRLLGEHICRSVLI
jgi:hypothetical protein